MTVRSIPPVALVAALVLGAAGCGSSSHPTAANQPTTTTTTAPPRSATTQKTATATTTTHAATTTPASATTTTASTMTAPPPIPAGTPTAPDGLTQTTGYSTYELCASDCSGAVPSSLRRPLHLPSVAPGAACPVSAGGGLVKPMQNATHLALTTFQGSAWSGAMVTWQAQPGYTGPVLIRGGELGGPHAVGFGEGHTPYDELQLLGRAMGAPSGPGRIWPSFTRVRGPGCYAYQVDGTSFSDVIVFKAT